VAVKVVKALPAYFHQARMEVGILQYLNTRVDPRDRRHLVRLLDFFVHAGHLCLVFELLGINLFELVRANRFRGLSLPLVRLFAAQLLDALDALRGAGVVHADVKPENVLLTGADHSGGVKLIDFGSACFEGRAAPAYVQSRFYRAPEVVLGLPHTAAIDAWSAGCVAAELFLGLPLFPAASELDLLGRVARTLGPPPAALLAAGARTARFYTRRSGAGAAAGAAGFRLRTAGEFAERSGEAAPMGRHYFAHIALADIVGAAPLRPGLDGAAAARERRDREAFVDFLLGVLDPDPATRWTPRQAREHPFISGAPFRGPFQPAADDGGAEAAPASPPSRAAAAGAAAALELPPAAHAALLASSPNAHAAAHAAALAAVAAHASARAAQAAAAAAAAEASPPPPRAPAYDPAPSLQRIVPTFAAAMEARGGAASGRAAAPGAAAVPVPARAPPSTEIPIATPPSRAFGAHLRHGGSPTAARFGSPSVGARGVLPLLATPTAAPAGEAAAPAMSFQPSSIATYSAALQAVSAAVASRGGGGGARGAWTPPSARAGRPPRADGATAAMARLRMDETAEPAAAEEPEAEGSWDPLDDLLEDDSASEVDGAGSPQSGAASALEPGAPPPLGAPRPPAPRPPDGAPPPAAEAEPRAACGASPRDAFEPLQRSVGFECKDP
jgi:dual specificity protein kinase YAK1